MCELFCLVTSCLVTWVASLLYPMNGRIQAVSYNIIGRLPVETLCHTFRTLILPIMTYAAEVWAYDVGIAYKKMMTAIQMKFLKYALGVGQSTPNVAVLLELGEYPVEMFLKMKVIDWWRKISNTDHILLKEALLIHQREQTPWFHHLSDTLAELGCNTEDPNSLALSREVIYTKLEQQYKQDIIHTVGNTAKLGVLRTCKQVYTKSSYLAAISIPAHRIALTKLRTSSHNLQIEQDRHCRNRPDRSARRCRICELETEDEMHFLISCPGYTTFRQSMFIEISSMYPYFLNMHNTVKFNFLMRDNLEDKFYKLIGYFVFNLCKLRSRYLK